VLALGFSQVGALRSASLAPDRAAGMAGELA
jgi:hypothetical protein